MLGTLQFLQLWSGVLEVWEGFLPAEQGHKCWVLCWSTQRRIRALCRERKMYSWFSHACHDGLLVSELFGFRLSAFDFRRRRRAAEKSVKQQSRVVTIETKKKTPNLTERKLSEAAPWCPFTLRHCPREPPGKWQDIFFPDNNVKKAQEVRTASRCAALL